MLACWCCSLFSIFYKSVQLYFQIADPRVLSQRQLESSTRNFQACAGYAISTSAPPFVGPNLAPPAIFLSRGRYVWSGRPGAWASGQSCRLQVFAGSAGLARRGEKVTTGTYQPIQRPIHIMNWTNTLHIGALESACTHRCRLALFKTPNQIVQDKAQNDPEISTE